RNIMQDCMLVNLSGHAGHWIAINMNIEHLIQYLKFLFAVKGLCSSWDGLADISAAVDYLQKIKNQVGVALRCYGGTKHTTPDTSSLVWKVADKQRHDNDAVKPIVDILAAGEWKIKSASLATFNKKVHTL
ncbi:hypothetical protein PILCRDRAFT_39225, partial [Piloderma croceum F 1598]